MLSYQEINNIIKGKLSYNRYRHTLGVINSAVELSEIHGENRNSARLAALIHDISKDIDNVEQINLANKYKIEIDKISAAQPSLLHGIIGSYIAKNNFGIIDREILNAIKYHTTGRANMSKLEKIIYLADYIEEGRNFPGLDTIRRIVKENLDQAMLLALDNSIQYIIQKQKLIHPLTIEARNDILHKMYYNN
ncbi:MAG TPA: HD domain-containing protein [Eubacteriaceae bacterium]|jgi:predicted HD superfamily hydrolase involved in NAD metabolism|nr:HD domain-containing protein [Eubacteriaceae bacterium]